MRNAIKLGLLFFRLIRSGYKFDDIAVRDSQGRRVANIKTDTLSITVEVFSHRKNFEQVVTSLGIVTSQPSTGE